MDKVNKLALYIQYGCGLSAPHSWVNFDVSPTLRVQKVPLLGGLLKRRLNVQFPSNVRYGDIVKGLPGVKPGSCDGVYCSHVLEHLCLEDFKQALKNTYDILRSGGIFRCVLPDLEYYARKYFQNLEEGNKEANSIFLRGIHLGMEQRPKTIRNFLVSFWGNANHMWMWDTPSLQSELEKAGFSSVRACKFNDSEDKMFMKVESEGRFRNALAFEAIK